jgi:ubiquinone/menaquinone biosynthesis C-methylase UbiE
MFSRWRRAWSATMDRQHRLPQGLLGQLVGEKMVRQHRPETDWTVGLLDLRPDDRILELGCGAGRGLALAARAVGQGMVAGMDLSPTMLQAAARRTRRAGRGKRVSLLRGNLAALPYADGSLDKIWSVHTFYFWPDPEAVTAELLRALAPGGVVAVTLATGTVTSSGADRFWPLQHQVEALAQRLSQRPGISAELRRGPNSRHYNNVAVVIRKE